ncbi:hypothetical protein CAEBREN_02791 [Caenorhabditis brenneri]|uniref:Uncharacterized protein n=1 Tax=Caenorhabditis brenneri TaxID=135651 RepID=G0NXD1_CAEBE|nr:hypothetical protein CAEBREN_02791 [Caenorhabditis brenneri]
MSSLVTCDPELLLQFQRDYHPDLRRRYMYTFFTHAKIPLGVIKRIIKTPTRRLEIQMIMWHLCNCEIFFVQFQMPVLWMGMPGRSDGADQGKIHHKQIRTNLGAVQTLVINHHPMQKIVLAVINELFAEMRRRNRDLI